MKNKDEWNAEYSSGKWDFLQRDSEQDRLRIISSHVDQIFQATGSGVVVDLGSGAGQLGHWLSPVRVKEYVAMDISSVALEQISLASIDLRTVCASLDQYVYEARFDAPVVVVASEVLTYNADSVDQLARIVGPINKLAGVIVSVVGPHPNKPNWTRASEMFWKKMSDTGWPKSDQLQTENDESGIIWDIGIFKPQQS